MRTPTLCSKYGDCADLHQAGIKFTPDYLLRSNARVDALLCANAVHVRTDLGFILVPNQLTHSVDAL